MPAAAMAAAYQAIVFSHLAASTTNQVMAS